MPYNTGWQTREDVREVVANTVGLARLTGRLFYAGYLPEEADYEKWVRPGMIVAIDSATGKFVPYNSSAAYGTGSDTAVGVHVDGLVNVTNGDAGIAPVYHGELIEDNCYVLGGTLGSVSTAIKSALEDIHWV